jgi:uncharacterized protein (DUF2062 family)
MSNVKIQMPNEGCAARGHLGHDIAGQFQYNDFKILMTLGRDVAVAMVAGGVLLGILPAVGACFLTFYLFGKIRARPQAGPARASAFNLKMADVRRKAASVM